MSIDGNWNLTLNTPMGAQNRALTLATDGGTLTGTIAGPQGNVPIEDGVVDGDNVSWAMMAPQLGAKIQFKGTVSGDSMNGNIELGAFGSAPFSGVRA